MVGLIGIVRIEQSLSSAIVFRPQQILLLAPAMTKCNTPPDNMVENTHNKANRTQNLTSSLINSRLTSDLDLLQ